MLIVFIMMMLIIMMMMQMMINTEKLEALKDYYKPIKTDDSFDGKKIAT